MTNSSTVVTTDARSIDTRGADARAADAGTADARAADATNAGIRGAAETGTDAAGKPTPDELGIDPAGLIWQRSGEGDGSVEIAFPLSPRWARGDWVLMRVAGDPDGRILVFDRNEWDCFLDGARNGEFDDATNLGRSNS